VPTASGSPLSVVVVAAAVAAAVAAGSSGAASVSVVFATAPALASVVLASVDLVSAALASAGFTPTLAAASELPVPDEPPPVDGVCVDEFGGLPAAGPPAPSAAPPLP
jgi:hypothetical protein